MPHTITLRPAETIVSRRLDMPADDERWGGIEVTTRCLLRDGAPWFPVTGEMHYSRMPRQRWREALELMRAGGITAVATYVFWIHHQPSRDEAPSFEGRLDVAAFIELAAEVGLDVVLRIGPWCHGEVRNGGHPDWVVGADYVERTNDPAYLADVREWFGHLGAQVSGLCGPDAPIVGIQIENELYDRPDHIWVLKELARQQGMRAPLWTATAWGGADIPHDEVFPLYGGYGDGFWLDTAEDWHPTFRDHFSFSEEWDDPGIGADVAGTFRRAERARRESGYPPATCELGGGMASAYHRRLDVSSKDVAAVALNKVGAGSIWQGYYMYVGGTNPTPGLQESHDSGYPNDMPPMNYDFNAPIGAHLQLRESYHRLRAQHALLGSFGDRLATMTATVAPQWALRSDGESGFLFLTTHRPHEPHPALTDIQFSVELQSSTVTVPHEPITIPQGTSAAWPINLTVNGVTLCWATATVHSTIQTEEGGDVLVLAAQDGVPVHLSFPGDHDVVATGSRHDGVVSLREEHVVTMAQPGPTSFLHVKGPSGDLRILVLDEASMMRAWVLDSAGRRRLVLTDADAVVGTASGLRVRTHGPVRVDLLPGGSHTVAAPESRHEVRVECLRGPQPAAPHRFGPPDRASAPSTEDLEERAARYRITITGDAPANHRSLLRLDVHADVGVARFQGRCEDMFFNGNVWDIDVTPEVDTDVRVVDVLLYPVTSGTPAHFPVGFGQRTDDPAADVVDARVLAPAWVDVPLNQV